MLMASIKDPNLFATAKLNEILVLRILAPERYHGRQTKVPRHNIIGSMGWVLSVTIMQSIATCYGGRCMSRRLADFEGPVSLPFFSLRKRPKEFFLMEARSLQRITADAFISGE
jgi:hypothetical protein